MKSTYLAIGGVAAVIIVLYLLFQKNATAAAAQNVLSQQPSQSQLQAGALVGGASSVISSIFNIKDAFSSNGTSNEPGLSETGTYSNDPGLEDYGIGATF